MKAVLQHRPSTGFLRRLRESAPAWLTLESVDDTDQPAVERALRDADVLLHVLTPVTGAMLRGAPRLKLMQKIGVGTNTMDLEAAAALDIAVCNMPGTNSRAVAEHTLALMLAVLRRLGTLDAACRQGRGWKLEPDLFDSIGEIGGRTVGFVGYGAIPRCLTPALLALGAQVVYVRRAAEPENETANDPRRLPSLAALLAQSDVVSLHLPLTGETRGILDARALQAMKPGAILINTARGGLVDEVALIAALRSGHLAAAGLDVFAAEPTAADNPLFALPNVVLTPHVAWLTPETLDRSIGVIMENCRRLRDGEPLLHRVV